jgi:hypothetical protein
MLDIKGRKTYHYVPYIWRYDPLHPKRPASEWGISNNTWVLKIMLLSHPSRYWLLINEQLLLRQREPVWPPTCITAGMWATEMQRIWNHYGSSTGSAVQILNMGVSATTWFVKAQSFFISTSIILGETKLFHAYRPVLVTGLVIGGFQRHSLRTSVCNLMTLHML